MHSIYAVLEEDVEIVWRQVSLKVAHTVPSGSLNSNERDMTQSLTSNFGVAFLCLYCCISATNNVFGIDWEKRNLEFSTVIQPILKKACLDCHSGAEADAGLALSHFQNAKSILKERNTWAKVIQRLEIGDMPPAEAAPLSKEDRARLTDWIRSTINDIECGLTPNPGSVTLRRLNRFEYQNTIRDLLGITYKPAEGFPGDDVGYGFDNIGDVLTLPPLLMEKYFQAAEEISQLAIQTPPPGPAFESRIKLEDLKADRGGSFKGGKFAFVSNGKVSFDETLPWKGMFRLEAGLAGEAVAGEGPKVRVSIDGKKLKEIEIKTQSDDKAETVPFPFRNNSTKKTTLSIEFTNDFYAEPKDGKPKQDRNLFIYDLKVVGEKPPIPVPESELTPVHRMIVRSTPQSDGSVLKAAQTCIQPIASKAFRRPVKREELERLAKIVVEATEEGDSYEAGLQLALQAILVSPHFLFKVEVPTSKKAAEYPLLDDYEFATRLSYFLWSSMPDQELLQLATKKQLRDPVVLKAQIKRMLEHRRSSEFVENFAGQWLNLRKLDQFEPSKTLFPQWNDEIKTLVRIETYRFFQFMMRNDQSILRLLDADYTFLNEKLAKFYGIPGVQGDEFRQVSTKGHKRMGILTHGSILAVTSNPTRTSPVKRGKWILDNLLATPPPPAPPGVPELEKGELRGTVRQQMEQHRADPACASCHKLMDPLGMALENYDAVGRWRTTDKGSPIDTSGELPNGESIKGPGDLIKSLREKNTEQFARCVTEKMLIYALGRGLEYYDRCAVDKIMVKLTKEDYRFSLLIFEIVSSDPFQRKGVRDEL